MNGAALLGTFVVARLLSLGDVPLPGQAWSLIALFADDVLVAAGFTLLTSRAPRWVSNWLYGLFVVVSAANVPLQRLFTWPLTPSMLRATHGALSDSILEHATLANGLCVALVGITGLALPRWTKLPPRTPTHVAAIVLAIVAGAFGPIAREHQPLEGGLGRQPWMVWLRRLGPRSETRASQRDLRASSEATKASEDHRSRRGSARGRNVLVIVLESVGARYLRHHGAPDDPMPTLTRLAAEGISFSNAWCVHPESVKGLMTLLCGVSPGLDVSVAAYSKVSVPSLAELLEGDGYRSGLFHAGRFEYLGMRHVVDRRHFGVVADAADLGGARESSFGVDEESTVRGLLRFVDDAIGRPFLAYYLPVAGHHPYEAPEAGPYPDDQLEGRYRNALRVADSAIAQLLDGLSDRGLLTNTLVTIVGDHGQAFGQHPGNFGHTFFVYEENLHIPLIFRDGGSTAPPENVRRPVSAVDVLPTLLDLLGIAVPPGTEGTSLLDPTPRISFAFADYGAALLAARDGPWKLVHDLDDGTSRLFDLDSDPSETRDVHALHPARTHELTERVTQWCAHRRAALLEFR